MITRSLSVILLLSASLLLVGSCKHRIEDLNNNTGNGTGNPGNGASSTPCDPNKIYFQQQVLPILVSNCAMSGCHDNASHEDGVTLTSYEKVMASGIISPGNPNGSDLYEAITDTDPGDRMPEPPRNPLTQAQIQLIRQWIQQGALNLVCQSMCDSSSFTFSGAIRTLISNKCQGCHSGSAAQGSIDLSTYNGIKAKVADGSLWGSINHYAGFSAMPKNGTKLSDCEIIQVRKWIEAGSPNN
ncbi:MAG TPA: c-type cytochrome domain-containing protein [Chitinophagaceae bacterium]